MKNSIWKIIQGAVVAYQATFLIAAAWAFHVNPNSPTLQLLAKDLNLPIIGEWFAAASALCALASPVVFFLAPQTQWRLYMLLASPILLYTIPVGYYLLKGGGSPIAAVIYLAIYASFILLALTTFAVETVGGQWHVQRDPAEPTAPRR